MNTNNYYRWMGIGALFSGLYVALGAFGAHGLESHLDVKSMATFQTGLRYMIIHALALILVNHIGMQKEQPNKAFNLLILAGIFLFSISLLIHATRHLLGLDVDVFAMLAPIGGLSYLAAWVVLCIKWFRQ